MSHYQNKIDRKGRQLIAVTGGIGSGKSYVLRCFQKLKFLTISCDTIVNQIYTKNQEAFAEIGRIFPNCIISNKIAKAILAETVLSNPAALRQLENIVHPLLRMELERIFQMIKSRYTTSLVVEIPLLFELNYMSSFDIIISTLASYKTQKARALERKAMTEKRFYAICSRQVGDDLRTRCSDYIVTTELSRLHTFKQIKHLVANGRLKRSSTGY